MADAPPVYDPQGLNLDEMAEVEGITGQPFMVGLAQLNALFLKGLVFVYERRDNPEFTIEEAGKVLIRDALSDSPNGAKSKPKAKPASS